MFRQFCCRIFLCIFNISNLNSILLSRIGSSNFIFILDIFCPSPDLWILTVSSCVTWFHCFFHGLTVGFAFLMVLQIFSGFFPTHSFLKKQTQAANSNANKERISSMINKNKTSIRSSLSLSWAFCSLC